MISCHLFCLPGRPTAVILSFVRHAKNSCCWASVSSQQSMQANITRVNCQAPAIHPRRASVQSWKPEKLENGVSMMVPIRHIALSFPPMFDHIHCSAATFDLEVCQPRSYINKFEAQEVLNTKTESPWSVRQRMAKPLDNV